MRPLLETLFARRAQAVIPPPVGAEIAGAVPVVTSFTFGLADPRLFPKADLARRQRRCWRKMGMLPSITAAPLPG
jgi:2-aminoadipate transaminase